MNESTHDMISVDGLRRVFPGPGETDVVAVDGIDLTVPRGQTVAILGPNGAGKTTLMRMLTTLLPPTSGSARIAGMDVTRDAHRVRSLIGYVGQGHSAGHTQRARDEVISQSRIHGADRADAKRRATELFTSFGLEGLERRRTQAMSGGQRRRLDLAIGLAHHPALLFLDEPTTGLDPQNRADLWEHIDRIRHDSGMTIVLTTHYLDEADDMADRIVIVDHGRVLADGTAQDLKQAHVGSRVVLTVADPAEGGALASRLAGDRQVLEVTVERRTVTARVHHAPSALVHLIGFAREQGSRVVGAQVHEPTLDDVFLALTGRALRDAAVSKESA